MKLKKGSKAAKDYMAKIRRMKKPAAGKHTDTKSHNVAIKIVSGVTKKQALKNDLKKAGLKLPHGYDVAKRINGTMFTPDEIKFLEKEGKKSKGYTYRAKILWGEPIVLKETMYGTPVQKFVVDTYEKATALSKELNDGTGFTKVKKTTIKK